MSYKCHSIRGGGSVATVYLGGGILKVLRVLIPRKSPLSHPQFQLATALLAQLLPRGQPLDAEARAQARQDFDVVMGELREHSTLKAAGRR